MFKLSIILIILIIISYSIYNYHITITPGIIKYPLGTLDKWYLKLHSTNETINNLENQKILFYTNTRWSTKNNNYIHLIDTDKYYIIEPGYYYNLDENYKMYGKLKIIKFK